MVDAKMRWGPDATRSLGQLGHCRGEHPDALGGPLSRWQGIGGGVGGVLRVLGDQCAVLLALSAEQHLFE